MRFVQVALATALSITGLTAAAQKPDAQARMTMAAAMTLAEQANPQVLSLEANLAAAEASRVEAARLFKNNPELSLGRTRRDPSGAGGSVKEWGIGIAQPFETGGQWTHRRESAAATLDSLRAEISSARRLSRANAAQRYIEVLSAKRRLQIEQRSAQLFKETSGAVVRRRAAGEDTRLDANVALLEAERAQNAVSAAQERVLDARSELATVLQMPPSALPLVVGELGPLSEADLATDLDRLLLSAQNTPQFRALAARQQAATSQFALERAARYPDVTIGLDVGREGAGEGRERVTTLSLSVPLPLFQRNTAAIGQALTDLRQAELERSVAVRDVQALIRRLWSRLQSQRERIERLAATMLPTSNDNQRLIDRSRRSGQISLLEQLVVNRQALDAERDFTEALTELHTTRIELERVAGLPIGETQP